MHYTYLGYSGLDFASHFRDGLLLQEKNNWNDQNNHIPLFVFKCISSSYLDVEQNQI